MAFPVRRAIVIHPPAKCPSAKYSASTSYYDTGPIIGLPQPHFQNPPGLRLWPGDLRVALKKYGYARDPVCLIACALYAANRWCMPIALKGPFLRNHFADLLLIPAALPLILWVQRRLRLRTTDTPPDWREVLMHLAVWPIAAEVVGPHLFSHATGDILDVVAYIAGAVVATVLWSLA